MRFPAVLIGPVALLALACGGAPAPGHEDEAEAPGIQQVRLSEQAVRAAAIEVVVVSREAFHPHVLASGVIRPVSDRNVKVRALVAGRVVRVQADVGDRVRAGQVLVSLEGSGVTAVLARHRTAATREEAARRALERAERLVEMKAISRAEVELRRAEAEAASAEAAAARQDLIRLGLDPERPAPNPDALAEFPVHAPISGVVLERSVSPGLLVEREAPLFDIADLSQVWAVVDVYQKDLGQIRERGEVEVQTEAYPEAVFDGRIALVEPALDEASRTAHVRVVLDNRSGKLRPGLFVTVAIPLRGASEVEATAVPGDAVQKISGLSAVFVEREPGLYELRPVETGREAHGMVEIRHGLGEGDRVVARGAFVLKSELLKGTIGGEEH
jgi:cobalt-zinc-cadmium efflux system membrane fusion protein